MLSVRQLEISRNSALDSKSQSVSKRKKPLPLIRKSHQRSENSYSKNKKKIIFSESLRSKNNRGIFSKQVKKKFFTMEEPYEVGKKNLSFLKKNPTTTGLETKYDLAFAAKREVIKDLVKKNQLKIFSKKKENIEKDKIIRSLKIKILRMTESHKKIEKLAMKKGEYLKIETSHKEKTKSTYSKELEQLRQEREMWREEAFSYKLKYEECLRFISKTKMSGYGKLIHFFNI